MLSQLLRKEKITHLLPRAYQMSTFDYQSTQVCTGSKNKGGRLFQKVHSSQGLPTCFIYTAFHKGFALSFLSKALRLKLTRASSRKGNGNHHSVHRLGGWDFSQRPLGKRLISKSSSLAQSGRMKYCRMAWLARCVFVWFFLTRQLGPSPSKKVPDPLSTAVLCQALA